MRMFRTGFIIGVALGMLASCGQDEPAAISIGQGDQVACAVQSGALRLNEIQSIGSHNSYKKAIPAIELAMIAQGSQEAAAALDYAHLPLRDQLELGIRQLELDIYYDPQGGRYGDPLLPRLSASLEGAVPYDATGLSAPGFKVLHVQDIDVRSHCLRFAECLAQVSAWSQQNPDHVPIMILINAKQDQIDVPGSVEALPFDAAAFEELDAEIIAGLGRGNLIVPDDVRGGAASLRAAVLSAGWPELGGVDGKFLFALDEAPDVVELYIGEQTSLEGRAMFVNSISENADHAAYFTRNDPLAAGDDIQALVAQGFLVRTRADADTVEARAGDTKRRDVALATGAQYVSTDYYQARSEFSDYEVALPDGAVSRCHGEQGLAR